MSETLHGRSGICQGALDGLRPFSEARGDHSITPPAQQIAAEGDGKPASEPGAAGFLARLRESGAEAFARMQRLVPEVIEAAALPAKEAADPKQPLSGSATCETSQRAPQRAATSGGEHPSTHQGVPVTQSQKTCSDAVRQAIEMVAATKDRQVDAAPTAEPATRCKPIAPAEAADRRSETKLAAGDPEPPHEPTASERERAERNRYQHEEWKRHKPQQVSPHRGAPGFGAWIDANPARVTDAPSALTSLIDARALAPALLEPAVPAKLNELTAYYEAEENSDGSVSLQRVEPFADVRTPLKPLTRAERKRIRSDEQRYQEYVMRADAATRRWAAWWRELGESTEHLPPTACPETYAMCRAVVCSREAADATLHMIGNNFGGNVLWRVMRSAFGDPDSPKWDTSSLCARRQIAIELFMLRQSRLKLAGRDRFGKPIMQPCVWGIGRGYLQSLLADPYSKKPLSRERLTHSNDSCMGIFHKAEAALVFVRQSKIPPEVADYDEIGPSGYTFNRYWVARHWNPKRALRDEPDGLSVAEASQRAWAWVDAGVRAALRGRFLHAAASVDQKWVARYESPS